MFGENFRDHVRDWVSSAADPTREDLITNNYLTAGPRRSIVRPHRPRPMHTPVTHGSISLRLDRFSLPALGTKLTILPIPSVSAKRFSVLCCCFPPPNIVITHFFSAPRSTWGTSRSRAAQRGKLGRLGVAKRQTSHPARPPFCALTFFHSAVEQETAHRTALPKPSVCSLALSNSSPVSNGASFRRTVGSLGPE